MIIAGDTVRVDFNGSQTTLCRKARVDHVPVATGDSWVFTDLVTEDVHHISEGCSVTKLSGYSTQVDVPENIETIFTNLASLCEHNKRCITGECVGSPSYWSSMKYWIDKGRNIS